MPGDIRRYTFDQKPIFLYGEKGSGVGNPKNVQDFYKIREQCLKSGKLFEDPEFPAIDKSVWYSKRPRLNFKWMRPKDICKDKKPKFFVDGFSRFDVQQGELGDCWFLAATANLTQDPKLFYRVVCEDNSFDDGKYAGIFHFVFWQFGRWVDVVVDDRLPVVHENQLYYMRSKENSEFWSALIEKAYAKLNGCYENLISGITAEALVDFTGGIVEMFDLNNPPEKLFHILARGFKRHSMLGCSVKPISNVKEQKTPEGLVRGHAYSITKASMFDIVHPTSKGQVPLLRIRNPWGDEAEWNGKWSDKSAEWKSIPEHAKSEIGLNFEGDGEFWMDFPDFLKYFDSLEICNLGYDSLTDESKDKPRKKWDVDMFEGEWVKGLTAGGCINPGNPFHRNPQFVISLPNADEDDPDGKCSIVISLIQKNRRSRKHTGNGQHLCIGFEVFEMKEKDLAQKPQTMEFFKYAKSVADTKFTNTRGMNVRARLRPGHYMIVPSTFDKDEEGEFLIRVFTETNHVFEVNDKTVGMGEIDSRISEDEQMMTQKEAVQMIFDDFAGEGKEIGWEELQKILNEVFAEYSAVFSKDVCRSMVAMLDIDRSGELGLEEFDILIIDIVNWMKAFKLYDVNNTKVLNAFEFRDALASSGYRLNNSLLKTLLYRYGSKDKTISFEDFITCAVKVKAMIETFNAKDINHDDRAVFSMDEWITRALYS